MYMYMYVQYPFRKWAFHPAPHLSTPEEIPTNLSIAPFSSTLSSFCSLEKRVECIYNPGGGVFFFFLYFYLAHL